MYSMQVLQIKNVNDINNLNLEDTSQFHGIDLNASFNHLSQKSNLKNHFMLNNFILLSDENYIRCYDKNSNIILELEINKINHLSLSMSSRCQRTGLPYIGIGIEYTFQIDLEIDCLDRKYNFEIFKPKYFSDFIDIINKKKIEYDDLCEVVSLYNKYPDDYERHKYLTYHFKEIAKKYGLDNPRE